MSSCRTNHPSSLVMSVWHRATRTHRSRATSTPSCSSSLITRPKMRSRSVADGAGSGADSANRLGRRMSTNSSRKTASALKYATSASGSLGSHGSANSTTSDAGAIHVRTPSSTMSAHSSARLSRVRPSLAVVFAADAPYVGPPPAIASAFMTRGPEVLQAGWDRVGLGAGGLDQRTQAVALALRGMSRQCSDGQGEGRRGATCVRARSRVIPLGPNAERGPHRAAPAPGAPAMPMQSRRRRFRSLASSTRVHQRVWTRLQLVRDISWAAMACLGP